MRAKAASRVGRTGQSHSNRYTVICKSSLDFDTIQKGKAKRFRYCGTWCGRRRKGLACRVVPCRVASFRPRVDFWCSFAAVQVSALRSVVSTSVLFFNRLLLLLLLVVHVELSLFIPLFDSRLAACFVCCPGATSLPLRTLAMFFFPRCFFLSWGERLFNRPPPYA